MQLDVRLPMGAMFTILGTALTLFGLFSDKAISAASPSASISTSGGDS